MAILVFDGDLFDSALFGGESVFLDDAIFDSAIFDVGNAGPQLTPRRALYWDGSIIREVSDAVRGTGKKPIVLLDGALRERATSEGTPVIVVDGQLRCLDTTTESLTL